MLELLRAVMARQVDARSRLLLGQLIMFAGIAAIFPVAPLYVRQHGGGAVAVALFIASPMVANMVVQIPAGYLVDRIGRKKVLIGSRIVYAAMAFALFMGLGPLWLLTVFQCVQGASGGTYLPALRAALADLTPPDRRGEQYARLQAVEMVGLLVGPAVGGALALWTYSAVYLCAGVATLTGIWALLHMPEPSGARVSEPAIIAPRVGWWRSPLVIIPSLGLLCAGSLFAMYDTVWPQYMTSRHLGPFVIGLSISLFALPVMLLAGRAGRLSDRGNRKVLVTGAFLLVACTAALYPELYAFPAIVGVGLIEAVGFTLVEPILFAALSESAPAHMRGRAMAVGGLFQSGGNAVGAGGLGALYGVSTNIPFWAGSGACITAAIVCLLGFPARPIVGARSADFRQLKAVEIETRL